MSYRSSPAFARLEAPCESRVELGRCRICGCTENCACLLGEGDPHGPWGTCGWADATLTLCDNPACLASARAAAAMGALA